MRTRVLFPILITMLFVLTIKETNCQSVKVDSIVSYSLFFDLNNFIKISESEKPKDILIDVNKNALKFNLQVGCILNSGSLLFEVYDPNGKKAEVLPLINSKQSQIDVHADFFVGKEMKPNSTVKYEGEDDSLIVHGHFIREFLNPLPGTWVIKVIPQEAEGKFKIHYIVNMK